MSSGTEFNAQYGSWYQYAIDYLMVCLDGGGKGGEGSRVEFVKNKLILY